MKRNSLVLVKCIKDTFMERKSNVNNTIINNEWEGNDSVDLISYLSMFDKGIIYVIFSVHSVEINIIFERG